MLSNIITQFGGNITSNNHVFDNNFLSEKERRQFFASMTELEKAIKQNQGYYFKFKYLEFLNQHRKCFLLTFTHKIKNIDQILEIKKYFFNKLKQDRTIKNRYNYFSVVETGKNDDNPHLHLQFWVDENEEKKIIDSILKHRDKTVKKYNLTQKRCQATFEENPTNSTYILKDYSNKYRTEEKYIARKKLTKISQYKRIRYISMSRFPHLVDIYKDLYKHYNLPYISVYEILEDNRIFLQKSRNKNKIIEYKLFEKHENMSKLEFALKLGIFVDKTYDDILEITHEIMTSENFSEILDELGFDEKNFIQSVIFFHFFYIFATIRAIEFNKEIFLLFIVKFKSLYRHYGFF